MGTRARHLRDDLPEVRMDPGVAPKTKQGLRLSNAQEALTISRHLQTQASVLDPRHRRKARRSRRLRRTARMLTIGCLIAGLVLAFLYLPLQDWWDELQRASKS